MPRKPAILAFVLLLLLSIGGAAFYHHLRQLKPGFSEMDTYLRTSAATGDWKFDSHKHQSYGGLKPGWWNLLGIRLHANYDRDNYVFENTLTTEAVLVSVWRENGKVINYHFSGSSVPAQALKDAIILKYPPLSNPRYQP